MRSAFLGLALAAANLFPAATLAHHSKALLAATVAPEPGRREKRSPGGKGGLTRKARGRTGWTVPQGKRRAAKRRNRLRHKHHCHG